MPYAPLTVFFMRMTLSNCLCFNYRKKSRNEWKKPSMSVICNYLSNLNLIWQSLANLYIKFIKIARQILAAICVVNGQMLFWCPNYILLNCCSAHFFYATTAVDFIYKNNAGGKKQSEKHKNAEKNTTRYRFYDRILQVLAKYMCLYVSGAGFWLRKRWYIFHDNLVLNDRLNKIVREKCVSIYLARFVSARYEMLFLLCQEMEALIWCIIRNEFTRSRKKRKKLEKLMLCCVSCSYGSCKNVHETNTNG